MAKTVKALDKTVGESNDYKDIKGEKGVSDGEPDAPFSYKDLYAHRFRAFYKP